MRYCCGLLKSVPMLRQLIEGETQESIQLRIRVCIEVHTASFRSTRGYTIVAGLLDEVSFWPADEVAGRGGAECNPAWYEHDTGRNAVVREQSLCAPGRAVGRAPQALWQDRDPILVWQAATREMNASVPQ